MMKKIGQAFGDELLKTGRQAGKQASQLAPGKLAGAAADQVLGGPKGGEKGIEAIKRGKGSNPKQSSVPVADQRKMDQLKQKDALEREAGLSMTRAELEKVKIKRYQEMQREQLKESQKKEGEIPAYEAGKPGDPRTLEEREEMIKKQRKKEDKKKAAGPKLPESTSKRPGLRGILGKIKGKKGTREIGKGQLG